MEQAEVTMNDCVGTTRDRTNQNTINLLGLAWVACWLGSIFGVKEGVLSAPIAIIAATLFTTAVGAAFVLAYRRFLSQADELRRKIELDALALSVGVGLIGGVAWYILQVAGLVKDMDINIMVLLICGSYITGIILGFRRFR